MNKMLDRVEALEEIIQPQAECSPWLRGALDPMTDEECKDVERFLLAAMLRRQDGTTSAQREAFEKFARKEAELKEEAVRRGEPVSEIFVHFEAWDEQRQRLVIAEDLL